MNLFSNSLEFIFNFEVMKDEFILKFEVTKDLYILKFEVTRHEFILKFEVTSELMRHEYSQIWSNEWINEAWISSQIWNNEA